MRALLLFLARQESFKNFALNFRFFRNTALRFVAGDTLNDAIRAVRQANQRRMIATLDLLGENTSTEEDANHACRQVVDAISEIKREAVECYFSVKLTQLGLSLNPDLSLQNLMQIVKHARDCGIFVRVDMEESRYTQKTLEIVERVNDSLGNVGAVIQSYLHRSEQDTAWLIDKRIPVRLVKGAYLEPSDIAFSKKTDTDANFISLMKMLLTSQTYHAIATHDESIISATKDFALSQRIPKDHFEFQMLYGIRRNLQLKLAQEGYKVRIYIPYGERWYAYFMRRLAERPANVAFIVRNLFRS